MTNVDNDRDRGIERLLGETLRPRAAGAASNACLDAEAAAAWADGTLSAHERSAAEGHAARCGRCQALLAAMVRSSPPAAARPWFRAPRIAWLAPLTAAAAALVVWTIVPPRAPLAPAEPTTSQTDAAAPQRAATQPPVGAAANKSPAPAASAPVAAPVDLTRQARAVEQQKQAVEPQTERREALSKTTAPPPQFAAADRDAAVPPATSPAPPAPPGLPARSAPPAVPPPLAAESIAPPAAAPLPDPAATAAAARSFRAPAPAADQQAARPAATKAEEPVTLTTAAESSLRRNRDTAVRQAPIIAPGSRQRWLIGVGGAVQHSPDGGSTWQTQQTGVSVTLTSGASPAPSVCWLVGPGGVVLLSTDARSWQALPFPEKVDLLSVRATDDRSATVAAADGRSFSTADRGVTWTPVRDR